jgi:hypothetical protein
MVAWMVIYTHCIWTATLNVTGCGDGGDQLWRLLLGFAPFTICFCLLVNVSAKLPDVHRILRWLAAPLAIFIPLALYSIWPTFVRATLGGEPICGSGDIQTWHVWWAPVQLGVIALILWSISKSWRERKPVPG